VPTTTEPPWLNFASGTAPRNGTTSHTITFPFTPTAGSYLSVFIYGAVTHTVAGWTEPEQPVAAGECSLFVKTAAGTVGTPSSDTSITVTHNGSNYPVNWVAIEWVTGTTLTGSVSTNDTTDPFLSLGGLPGTPQVVIAVKGRNVSDAGSTGASTAWSGSWVGDVDLFTAQGVTDGAFLAVGHIINETGTTSSPTGTTTYSGTWSTTNRERITVAFDVVAPPPSMSLGNVAPQFWPGDGPFHVERFLPQAFAVDSSGVVASLEGASSSVSTSTGSLVLSGALSGNATSSTSVSGQIVAVATIIGSANSVTSATGAVGTRFTLSGSGSSTTSATGAVGTRSTLAGTGASTSSSTGALVTTSTIAGTATSSSATTGNLSLISTGGIAGDSSSVSAATGVLTLRGVLSGTASSVSSSVGAVTTRSTLSGVASSSSASSGAVTGTLSLVGSASSVTSATGAVTARSAIAGTASSVTSATGAVLVYASLAGVASSTSTSAASLAIFQGASGSAVSVTVTVGSLTMSGVISGGALSLSITSGDVVLLYAAGHVFPRRGYASSEPPRTYASGGSRNYAEPEGTV
jgi:hypothetical protein